MSDVKPPLSYTQKRFNEVFGTEDFEVVIKCRKCGSTNVDLRFDPGHVYSDRTADSACVEVWCCDCKHVVTCYDFGGAS